MKKPKLSNQPKGFALVITLMLMIILTVVAVGLLSLSSISIRTSSQSQAVATARANARLALMLALGDLQKSLGPDRAITANSDILEITPNTIKKYNTAGVWESWWDFNPNSSPTPDYVAQKTSRFRRWLVSSADPTANLSRDFALAAWPSDAITLVGGGSLGVADNPKTRAIAGRVNISAGKSKGAYAWHVADESQKARINAYRDPTKNTTLAEKTALLAGHRPDPSVIDSKLDFLPNDSGATAADRKDNFEKATKIAGKLSNLSQFDLVTTNTTPGRLKEFRNDVTPYSLGVLTDVRNGGLKQDLSSLFELGTGTATNLPPEFSGEKLYQSTLGITGFSDPYWSTLSEYYNCFKNLQVSADTVKPLQSSLKDRNTETKSSSGALKDNLTQNSYQIGPVINKVEVVFSLVAREAKSTWMGKWLVDRAAEFDYSVNLVFSPRITLHNPYNLPISFESMKITLDNVPVGFKFSLQRGGLGTSESQSYNPSDFESLNEMVENVFDNKNNRIRPHKKFVVYIGNWSNTTPYLQDEKTDGPVVIQPGQTQVFKAFIDPAATFQADSDNDYNTKFFDWSNHLSPVGLKVKSGKLPDLGFEINTITASNRSGGLGWFLLLRDRSALNPTRPEDKFCVEYKMQQPHYFPDEKGINLTATDPASFIIDAQIKNSKDDNFINYAKLEFDYVNDKRLKELFPGTAMRYPPDEQRFLAGREIFATSLSAIGTQSTAKKFATFSAYSRTTNGGVYETGERIETSGSVNSLKDGRIAGKPFLFHNPGSTVYPMDLGKAPNLYPYELNLQEYEQLSSDDLSRNPTLTGNTDVRGIKSGSYIELPVGPLQTIADFRRSNTLTTPYLPQFTQPISNSLLHPSMSSNKVIETNQNQAGYPLLDHSFLANHALYDRFYFSTFATRGSSSPSSEFDEFMKLLEPMSANAKTASLLNQSFTPYLPQGKTASFAKNELFAGAKPTNNAYQKVAEHQLIRGPFNVNSTSVAAWKSVIAAMNKSDVTTLWAKSAAVTSATTSKVPVFGMSLLNGGGSTTAINGSQIDNKKTNDWNGFRELEESELDLLANKIVDQVRLRGPFLSMSEFVNRQIGNLSDLSLAGALEKAVSDSGINNEFLTGLVKDLTESDFTNTALYDYKTPKATTGNPAAGAPGWVSQGDLLRILEPAATVRSDTFVIRVCGQAKDVSGGVTATAYAEAVVQRVPEYIDQIDRPSLSAYDQVISSAVTSRASLINKAFGRRVNVVSFRWLSASEI